MKRPLESISSLQDKRAWIEINHTAVAHNVRQICLVLSPRTELMAVVKADAYGHGAVPVARTVLGTGASSLAVATVPEAIELRTAGIQAAILVLGPITTPDEAQAAAHWQLQATICSSAQAHLVSRAIRGSPEPLSVHAKIDTGMSRLGVLWHEAEDFVQTIRRLPNLVLAGIYSHLATAELPDQTAMREQQARFDSVVHRLRAMGICPGRVHLANSAAALTDRSFHYDLVRVGMAIYGLYPSPLLRAKVQLEPTLQVKARVIHVKTVPAGSGVSYGHSFVTNRETRLAVIGIGYADGVPRRLSNQMKVLLRGRMAVQVGIITMDQLIVDVGGIPEVREGDVCILVGCDRGNCISADDWAVTLGTIAEEVICGFSARLPRAGIDTRS